MKIFAVELSSQIGSIAFIENGVTVIEKNWKEDFKNRQQLFDAMAELEMDWADVDLFAVGRGPGTFSGMRIAFSVVNSLAAPGDKPVYALNSGAALAECHGAQHTAVVGDARRKKVWAGVFSGSRLEKEFELIEPESLSSFVPADALVLSPDYDRLNELLGALENPSEDKPVFPSAGTLGQLVYQRLENSVESEPFEPLYMHPPVFVEPRFPA